MTTAAPDPTPEAGGDGKDPGSRSAGPGGAVFVDASTLLELFGREHAGFASALVVLGCGFTAASMTALVENPGVWHLGEFLAVLGFGTLLVVLGYMDRVLTRKRRQPVASEDTDSTQQGKRQITAQESPPDGSAANV